MSKNTEWLNRVCEIKVAKSGKLYIQFTENEELFGKVKSILKPGQRIMCQKKSEELEGLASRGVITEDECERRKESQAFIKYVGTIGPDQD